MQADSKYSEACRHGPLPRRRRVSLGRPRQCMPEELRSLAVAQMHQMLGPGRVPQAGGSIDAVVAYVDWYARSKAVAGWFNAQQFALWRLFQTMVPTANDSGWDRLRARVTTALENSGSWERAGGARGQQWRLHRPWGQAGASIAAPEAVCRRPDSDGGCRDGMDDPRFCALCALCALCAQQPNQP